MQFHSLLRPLGAKLCSTAGCPEKLTGQWRYCDKHLPAVKRQKPEPKPARKPNQNSAATRERILEHLAKVGGVDESSALLEASGSSTTGFTLVLNSLIADGSVVKVRRRVYALPGSEGKNFFFASDREMDRHILSHLEIGKRAPKKVVIELAGSRHLGRTAIARLQRLGMLEVIGTATVKRVR